MEPALSDQLIAAFAVEDATIDPFKLSLDNIAHAKLQERLDRTRSGDKSVELPCVGVFEIEAGKIKTWRDYFDFATYQRGLA